MTSIVCLPAWMSFNTFGACFRSDGVPASDNTCRLT